MNNLIFLSFNILYIITDFDLIFIKLIIFNNFKDFYHFYLV